MKKVYVVTSGCYSDYGIVGIFSSPEMAQEYIDLEKSLGKYSDLNEIEEWGLDDLRPSKVHTRVWMGADGTVDNIYQGVGTVDDAGFMCFTFFEPHLLTWQVATDDKKRAVKVVNERRVIILANNEWGNEKAVRERFGK